MGKAELLFKPEIQWQMKQTLRQLAEKNMEMLNRASRHTLTVEKRERDTRCNNCGHLCIETCYCCDKTIYIRIVSYFSCDCGYDNIYNIGDSTYERYPGTRPAIWSWNPEKTVYSATEITEKQAELILETRLVSLMPKDIKGISYRNTEKD